MYLSLPAATHLETHTHLYPWVYGYGCRSKLRHPRVYPYQCLCWRASVDGVWSSMTKVSDCHFHTSYSSLAPILAAINCTSIRQQQILFEPTPGEALFAPDVTSANIATKMKQVLTETGVKSKSRLSSTECESQVLRDASVLRPKRQPKNYLDNAREVLHS